jgi:hypothetical protein
MWRLLRNALLKMDILVPELKARSWRSLRGSVAAMTPVSLPDLGRHVGRQSRTRVLVGNAYAGSLVTQCRSRAETMPA